MFVSKKFATPLIVLLVACMAVNADVSLPQECLCTNQAGTGTSIKTPETCALVGQGAAMNGLNCELTSQSAYNSFFSLCAAKYDLGEAHCATGLSNVPLPQACSCADPSEVNTVAQTKYACSVIGNTGSIVDDKCVFTNPATYSLFTLGCPKWFPGSAPVCSAQ